MQFCCWLSGIEKAFIKKITMCEMLPLVMWEHGAESGRSPLQGAHMLTGATGMCPKHEAGCHAGHAGSDHGEGPMGGA